GETRDLLILHALQAGLADERPFQRVHIALNIGGDADDSRAVTQVVLVEGLVIEGRAEEAEHSGEYGQSDQAVDHRWNAREIADIRRDDTVQNDGKTLLRLEFFQEYRRTNPDRNRGDRAD